MSGRSETFSSLCLTLTYRCTVACRHCMVEAAPYKKEYVNPDHARDWISQARAYRGGVIDEVTLTGGEPFYDVQMLRNLSDHAAGLGLRVSVMTNAFWAPSFLEADTMMKSLPAVSLLSVSTDEYHLKSIPLEHVRNAAEAARANGRMISLEVCVDSRHDQSRRALMSALSEFAGQSEIHVHLVHPVGRAKCYGGSFHYTYSPDPSDLPCPMSGSASIFPEGNVFGCLGPVVRLPPPHPLMLGSVREEQLSAILDRAERNLLLRAIRVWGPKRLVSMLAQGGFREVLPASYIQGSVCDVCHRLFASEEALSALDSLHAVRAG
jgi:pyruvate-formate lyase-activating enzyme